MNMAFGSTPTLVRLMRVSIADLSFYTKRCRTNFVPQKEISKDGLGFVPRACIKTLIDKPNLSTIDSFVVTPCNKARTT